MNGTRLARNTSAAAVAGIAAWSSWSHMVHVALHYGERPEVAYVLPLSVDGMLVVATVAMADDKRSGRRVRASARLAFLAGVVASVAANIAAAHPSIGARIVAGWPALALLLVVEMLSRSGRPADVEQADESAQVHKPMGSQDTTPDMTPDTEPDSGSNTSPDTDRTPDRPRRATSNRTRQPDTTAAKVARLRQRQPDMTQAEAAQRIGVSVRTVARHWQAAERDSGPDTAPVNGRPVADLITT